MLRSLTNRAQLEGCWDIISNEDVLHVSSAWAGHPGSLVKNSSRYFSTTCEHGASAHGSTNCTLPAYQIWKKPLEGNKLAVLFVNIEEDASENISVELSDLGLEAGAVGVYNLYTRTQSTASGSLTVPSLAPHTDAFFILSPST